MHGDRSSSSIRRLLGELRSKGDDCLLTDVLSDGSNVATLCVRYTLSLRSRRQKSRKVAAAPPKIRRRSIRIANQQQRHRFCQKKDGSSR